MAKVTIDIDSKWLKIAHSPLYWIVAALQGVSITFAPALNGLSCRRASPSSSSSGFSIFSLAEIATRRVASVKCLYHPSPIDSTPRAKLVKLALQSCYPLH